MKKSVRFFLTHTGVIFQDFDTSVKKVLVNSKAAMNPTPTLECIKVIYFAKFQTFSCTYHFNQNLNVVFSCFRDWKKSM